MKKRALASIAKYLLLSLVVASMVLTLEAADSAVTKPMVGHWEGSGRIVVAWCSQQRLAVGIDIHPDGSVTGKIGDATLRKGRFTRNRGWLGRKLNLATDYIITGDLAGPIVAAEGITRASVKMPLDFADGHFDAGVNTSGSMFGGKKTMVFTAFFVKLTRVD